MIYLYATLNYIENKNIKDLVDVKGIFGKDINILHQNSMLFVYSIIEKEIEKINIQNLLEHHTLIDFWLKNQYVHSLLPFQIPTLFDRIESLKVFANQKKEHLEKQLHFFENKVEYTLFIDFERFINHFNFNKNIDIKDKKTKDFLEKKINQPFYQINRFITTLLKNIDKNIVLEYEVVDKKCIFLVDKKLSSLFEQQIQQYLQNLNTTNIFQLSGFWAVHHFSKLYYG
jgi:hypothetical protein